MSKASFKKSIFAKIRNNFIAGIVVLIPIGITLYLTLFIIKISSKVIPKEINPNNYLPFDIPGVEILIALIVITIIGWLSLSFLGNSKYNDFLYKSSASIVIVKKNLELKEPVKPTLIRVDDPNLAFSVLLEYFNNQQISKTGIDKGCDYIFLVHTSKKIQKRRVLMRPNMTEKKFELINNSQWSFEKKTEKNPFIINTSYGKFLTFVIVIFYLLKIRFREKKID